MTEIKEKPSTPFSDFEFYSKEEEFDNFKHYKTLKFGDLYKYKDLEEYWYFDNESKRIRFINQKIVERILEWNNYDLKLNREEFEKIISIKGLPSSKYSFNAKSLEFPVKVKLKNGEEIDFCILLVSKSAPFQYYYQNVIFINSVEEIKESDFTLPHKYRISSMNAKEVMMSTYPFAVKSKLGEILLYNGKTQYTTYGEIQGNEIIEEIDYNQSIRGKYIDNADYSKITYIIVDWDDRFENIYNEYHMNIKE